MHRIFVYGTLKRGFPNHDPGMRDATLIGTYRTREMWPLVVAGRWFSPVMMPEPGVGRHVTGEVYEVGDAKLAELDWLESVHLPMGYRREPIVVQLLDGNDVLEAWCYFKARDRIEIVHSAYLDDYQDHRYVPLAQRES